MKILGHVRAIVGIIDFIEGEAVNQGLHVPRAILHGEVLIDAGFLCSANKLEGRELATASLSSSASYSHH
jgi:hypothetical protein